jgi:hypothetical protein
VSQAALRYVNILSVAQGSQQPPSLQAFSTCCTSALDSLRIVSREFTEMHVLASRVFFMVDLVYLHDMQHYGQETVTVMTAYSAVFLVKVRIENL